ncbi:MAG: CPBP family intramembrane metalloprotease [Polyangiaceae bacterium]|nr:CPBP family intramembrane metalloprotease [Polyangiaceae bacterium]
MWTGLLGAALALGPVPSPLSVPPLPWTRLHQMSWIDVLLSHQAVKALLPVPVLAALAPLVWWFFRDTWKRLDREAAEYRASRTSPDYRPMVCMVIVAIVLTLQEYYGGRGFYEANIRPWLVDLESRQHIHGVNVDRYDEFYGYCWWAGARIVGYVFVPLPLWKLLFPRDSLLDMGLRVRGFFRHLWIYGLCLAFVIPAMLLVASQPDFGTYYPFYKQSSRSWFDLLIWEGLYFVQFFALEVFFRGWIVGALRKTMGAGAIVAMAVPYCMIHYGKPYLEANGAIVAGIVLGSLAMRTRSVYAGFLVHITVAGSMDLLALWHRAGLPTQFWPPG